MYLMYMKTTANEIKAAAALVVAKAEARGGVYAARRVWCGKVFVAAVYAELAPDCDLATFKDELVSLRREVILSRADMVQEMPADCVAASETLYLNARWHFVNVG